MTTQERRKITSNEAQNIKNKDQREMIKNNFFSEYGDLIEKDESNRNQFLSLNSQLTGLTYEYNNLLSIYSPLLEEKKYNYKKKRDNKPKEGETESEYYYRSKESLFNFEEKSFWDSFLLHYTLNNTLGYNFFEDENQYPEDFLFFKENDLPELFNSEINIKNEILSVIEYNYNISENKETYLISDFFYYMPFLKEQNYIILNDPTSFNINDKIIIKSDDGISYGIVLDKIDDSILFCPYFIKGVLSEESSVYTYLDDEDKKTIIDGLISEIISINENILRYLENNEDKKNEDIIAYDDILYILDEISKLNYSFMNYDDVSNFFNDYFKDEDFINNRINHIRKVLNNEYEEENEENEDTGNELEKYLSEIYSSWKPEGRDKYTERLDILKKRINIEEKRGTLLLANNSYKKSELLLKKEEEKEKDSEVFQPFHIILCENDGDYFRRVFVKDEADLLSIGDKVFILTDDEEVPEVFATIDDITRGRLPDMHDFSLSKKTKDIELKKYELKKVFFNNFYINGKKIRRYKFSDKYKTLDGFRILLKK